MLALRAEQSYLRLRNEGAPDTTLNFAASRLQALQRGREARREVQLRRANRGYAQDENHFGMQAERVGAAHIQKQMAAARGDLESDDDSDDGSDDDSDDEAGAAATDATDAHHIDFAAAAAGK